MNYRFSLKEHSVRNKFALILIVILLAGCSGNDNPASLKPLESSVKPQTGPSPSSTVLGMWKIQIDETRQNISINPSRFADTHLDLTGYFLPPSCTDCLLINNVKRINDKEFKFDTTIKHPLPGHPEYTVFDVRGVLITGTNFSFPEVGKSIAFGPQQVELVNADGYTDVPEEVAAILPEHEKISGSLFAFKAFNPENPRRMFKVTDSDTRTFHIKAPGGPVQMKFVIEANWAKPLVEKIVDPLVDFPSNANCPEPYRIDVELASWPLLNQTAYIRVQVFTHHGEDTINKVVCEAPGMFDGIFELEKDESCGCVMPVYKGFLPNTLGAEDGQAPILITVSGLSSDPARKNVSAYQLIKSLADLKRKDENSPVTNMPGTASFNARQLLSGHEQHPELFTESRFGDLIVLWRQQTVSNSENTAIVEHAQKVYQFDAETGELRKKIDTWRHDLPSTLPKIIPQKDLKVYLEGQIQSVELFYMSLSSYVFQIDFTLNPFYVIRTDKGEMVLVDAITGKYLGKGIPPPESGYAFSGPQYDNPCSGSWTSWYWNAKTRFENLGYLMSTDTWPAKAVFQSYVQDNSRNVIYEFGHGASTYFASGCSGGTSYVYTTASDITTWMTAYNKKDFVFLGHCDGLCSSGSGTLSFAFRKGSSTETTTVGYCGMSSAACATCWTYSLSWQDTFFALMEDTASWSKYAVYSAFQQANANYPMCGTYNCMRFAGDPAYKVPVNYAAGHLCEECKDCASFYCEGSLNNRPRCGLIEPPKDGWVGGGDIPGCGDDPSSKYYDYYFDASGNLQFEITSTYDCDLQDICNGPEKVDFYVVENTNTCASRKWIQSEDGWYGGGDKPGCGPDPVAEYRQFYIDENYEEKYSVIDTFSCDTNDKCTPPYVTDYFVIEKTNQCSSKSWIEVDPLAPILDNPPDGHQFVLGLDLLFRWHAAPGTSPKGYWFRVYHDGELLKDYGADAVNGFYFGNAVTYKLISSVVEIVAGDGLWEWQIGAHYQVDKNQDIHWSVKRSIKKQTAGILLKPDDGKTVSINELFEWSSVPGAANYVAKITGMLPGNQPYYLPLNNAKTIFVLSKPYYDFLKTGEYSWSIAGTRYFTDDQKILGSLSYSEPSRVFYK